MKRTHYISIAAAIALVAVLYLVGNTVPPPSPKRSEIQPRPMVAQGVEAITTESVLAGAKSNLDPKTLKVLAGIESRLSSNDSEKLIPIFRDLASFWKNHSEQGLYAFYSGLVAKLENSENDLTFAARLFSDLMADDENPASKKWEALNSIYLGTMAMELDPTVEENKLLVATGYIEGVGEPMKGVQMLLDIVSLKPDDKAANLLLGKMSVESGQMDKAVSRLGVVLKQDSTNKEALYFLAEAYRGKGENKKAIELLEKCKQLVHDSGFSAKADEEINALK